MALATYSDLKTTVANYLGRSDLTSQIPDFITLAELRLSRELRIRQMITNASLTVSSSAVNIPSDFLEIRDMYLDGNPRVILTYLSPAVFTRDARTADTGQPVFYTMNGSQFEFAPAPDNTYTAKIMYYAKPSALSDSNVSNSFLANAPDALLYASLLEAEPYLMNDARIQVWASLYDRAINNINISDEESEFPGVPLTMKVS